MTPFKIALLIPVLNRKDLLIKTLQSLPEEPALDVVIVDCSTPALTLESSVCRHRVIVLWHPPGVSAQMNAGLRYILANDYQYVARIDAGDFATPKRFEKQVQFLEENPAYGLVGSLCEDLDGNNLGYQDIPSSRLRRRLHITNLIAAPAVMLTTKAILTTGFFNIEYRVSEDWDYWLRLSKHFEIRNLPEVLTKLDTAWGSACRDTLFSKRIAVRFKNLVLLLRHCEFRDWESYLGVLNAIWVLVINIIVPETWIRNRRKIWKRVHLLLGRQ